MKKRKIGYGEGRGTRDEGRGAGRGTREAGSASASTLLASTTDPVPAAEPAIQAIADEVARTPVPSANAALAPSLAAAAPAPVAPTAPAARTLRQRAERRGGSVELLLFRVGAELFGVELGEVEEVFDLQELHRVPEMPESLLGVFPLRGSLVPLYAPDAALGAELRDASSALVFNTRGRRVAIAVDDVDDVLTLALPALRDVPGTEAGDGVLAGVARRGPDLIGVLEVEPLLAQLRAGHALETP